MSPGYIVLWTIVGLAIIALLSVAIYYAVRASQKTQKQSREIADDADRYFDQQTRQRATEIAALKRRRDVQLQNLQL
jgi:hypothetical protein